MDNFKDYFVIYIDKPFTIAETWHGKTIAKDSLEITSTHSGAVIGFKTEKGEKVNLRVASSFISFDQAELNLKRELGNDSFDVTCQKAKAVWKQRNIEPCKCRGRKY